MQRVGQGQRFTSDYLRKKIAKYQFADKSFDINAQSFGMNADDKDGLSSLTFVSIAMNRWWRRDGWMC